jgi:hypothetical protein
MLTGFKTIGFNAAIIAAVAVLQYLSNVSWADYLGPTGVLVAPIIVAGINIALRFVTTSPALGRKPADA